MNLKLRSNTAMSKKIVLLSDGTGNSSAKLFKTNVWRLYEALDLTQPDQIAYYDNGVGTSAFKPYAILGGAMGLGLKRNVKDIYAFLCRNWKPGDAIYAFGFSRGAFTIRVLVAFVHDQGLVLGAATEKALWQQVHANWNAYRRRVRTRILGKIRTPIARILGKIRTRIFGPRALSPEPDGPKVTFNFVGLWDTVAAYGLPADELTRAWDQWVWPISMEDRVPCSSIVKAFHALSLDDERHSFHPVLWTEDGEPQNSASKHLDDERISQIWFAGVHSNVGGGYPDDSLSYVSLDWMMQEARMRGLRFGHCAYERIKAELTADGPIYDSRKGVSGYYRYNPRKIEILIDDSYHKVKITRPKIHESVFARIASGSDRYAPIVLPGDYAMVTQAGAIQLPTLETPSQAAARSVDQERAWDIVWKRRVVYFLTLLASGFLLLFPAIFTTAIDGACLSDYFCQLSKPLAWVKPMLPAFTDRWIDAFRSNPGWFAAGVAVLALMLLWSASLKTDIRDEMRQIWDGILAKPTGNVQPPTQPSSFIRWLRTSRWYQSFFKGLTHYVLPGLFALAIYCFAFVILSRFEVGAMDAIGTVCKASENARIVTSSALFSFETSNPCAASGYLLQKGVRYRLWIQIDEHAPWSDAGIATDLAGFSSSKMTWPMYFGLPFRRWITEPWFKPVARIDPHGNDEYVLDPSLPFTEGEKRDRMCTEIRARRDGELFLYVNDAIFLWPRSHTYGNNSGTASVTIKRIEQ
jgi:uncharacterized protein (DUF2235 family)